MKYCKTCGVSEEYCTCGGPPMLAKERRERIATAVLQGIAASNRTLWDAHGPMLEGQAERVVRMADALIAELDK